MNLNKITTESKLVNEVKSIIENPVAKRIEKIQLLDQIKLEGRPGKEIANALIIEYKLKFHIYQQTKLVNKSSDWRGNQIVKKGIGDSPRGLDLPKLRKSGVIKYTNYFRKFSYIYSSDCEIIAKRLGIDLNKQISRKKATILHNKLSAINLGFKEFAENSGFGSDWRNYYNKSASVDEVQANKAGYGTKTMYCLVDGWYITVSQTESEDWEYYSKAWHKSHGPKRTIESRNVCFSKGKERKIYTVESFAGNYLYKAIDAFFGIGKIKVSKELKPIQLMDIFGVEKLRQIGKISIYARAIKNTTIDYCAFDGKNTFHAATKEKAIEGLRKKLQLQVESEKKRLEADNKVLSYDFVHETYGFCETGTRSFCELNGLQFDGEYTIKEIRQAVVQNRKENCQRYAGELKTIGIVLNCK